MIRHTILENGATVIDQAQSALQRAGRGWSYCLCKWGDEFVVWQVDDKGNAECGNYFDNLSDANECFIRKTTN